MQARHLSVGWGRGGAAYLLVGTHRVGPAISGDPRSDLAIIAFSGRRLWQGGVRENHQARPGEEGWPWAPYGKKDTLFCVIQPCGFPHMHPWALWSKL